MIILPKIVVISLKAKQVNRKMTISIQVVTKRYVFQEREYVFIYPNLEFSADFFQPY